MSKSFLVLALLVLNSVFIYAQADSKTTRKAIICLTYDDGLSSQLTTALSQLDAVGLKATFFLNSIQGSSEKIGEASPVVTGWTRAAANGHELANHTLFHACPERLGWSHDFAIENYTIEKLIHEIKTENDMLSLIDPKRKIRSYAYPCNNFMIGNNDYSQLILEQGLVKYGRGGGDRTSMVTDFKNLNTMKVPSWMVEERTPAKDLIAFAEKVKLNGGLGVYQFHSIDGLLFSISKADHQALLDYLRKNQNYFLITTFSEAIELISKEILH